jgi:hypothetical protein
VTPYVCASAVAGGVLLATGLTGSTALVGETKPAGARATRQDTTPLLTVRLYNEAGVPPDTLTARPFPKGAAVLILSRSGRTVEVVRLVDRIRESQSAIIAVTNTPNSPLAIAADATVHLDSGFDHLVSVVMYSGLVLGGGLIAASIEAGLPDGLPLELASALDSEKYIGNWRERIEQSNWLDTQASTYFLARGPSLATAHEARLAWEEAAKMPASSLTHGRIPARLPGNGVAGYPGWSVDRSCLPAQRRPATRCQPPGRGSACAARRPEPS